MAKAMILIQRRFQNVNVRDAEICFTLENAMGAGGGNIPMVIEIHDKEKDTDNTERSGGGGHELELRRTGRNSPGGNAKPSTCSGN